MLIQGVQKTTVVDYPGYVACTIFTRGCNYKCPYCHNPSLVIDDNNQSLSIEEVLTFLNKRKGLLDGVCISGGEPLLQPDLKEFIGKVKAMGYLIKLDTNGSLPDKLKELMDLGLLDYIAMDIKHTPDDYNRAIGMTQININGVNQSIKYLMESGVEYEFRTTVVKGIHEPKDFTYISHWISGAKAYYIQNYKQPESCVADFTNSNQHLESFTVDELECIKNHIKNNVPNVVLRNIN